MALPFTAIPLRPCTRVDDDGRPLTPQAPALPRSLRRTVDAGLMRPKPKERR
ncbi:MAG: hypothetical protein ACK57J_03090 [Rubrivivax sp.]